MYFLPPRGDCKTTKTTDQVETKIFIRFFFFSFFFACDLIFMFFHENVRNLHLTASDDKENGHVLVYLFIARFKQKRISSRMHFFPWKIFGRRQNGTSENVIVNTNKKNIARKCSTERSKDSDDVLMHTGIDSEWWIVNGDQIIFKVSLFYNNI